MDSLKESPKKFELSKKFKKYKSSGILPTEEYIKDLDPHPHLGETVYPKGLTDLAINTSRARDIMKKVRERNLNPYTNEPRDMFSIAESIFGQESSSPSGYRRRRK